MMCDYCEERLKCELRGYDIKHVKFVHSVDGKIRVYTDTFVSHMLTKKHCNFCGRDEDVQFRTNKGNICSKCLQKIVVVRPLITVFCERRRLLELDGGYLKYLK